ncbi:MAG: hypothetical protein VXU42_06545, partial [Verrucomicrobiota bacterium]|nr:hypothetical protein [Verrucomicrobiota bacterium]
MNNQFLAWYENLGFSGSSQSALLFPSFSDHFPTIFYSSFLLRELTKVLIFSSREREPPAPFLSQMHEAIRKRLNFTGPADQEKDHEEN